MIKNIIFDLGGVLIDWNPRHLYRDYFHDDTKMEYFLTNICTSEWNEMQDGGRPFAEGVKILQEQFPEYSKEIQLYDTEWEKMIRSDFPESVVLMHNLKLQGYKIYGLSNWSAEKIPLAMAKFPFFNDFDGLVVSGAEKIMKPNIAIYKLLLSKYSINPKESLYLDDNAYNLTPAQSLGIKTILFNASDFERIKKEIESTLK